MNNSLHQPMDWETTHNGSEEMEWEERKKKKNSYGSSSSRSKNRTNFWKREN